MQVTRMFYENALNFELNLRGLNTFEQSEIILKSLFLSFINPMQQICVYLRSSAVNILLNFIQLGGYLNVGTY